MKNDQGCKTIVNLRACPEKKGNQRQGGTFARNFIFQ
jgi:hypothetical protein